LPTAIPDILGRIVRRKRDELSESRQDWAALEQRAEARIEGRRDFAAALRAQPPAIIAEIKQASPSRGLLTHDFDPARMARQYQTGGAAALSVLTDHDFFAGSLVDLETARAAVEIPVLRKDFTLEARHVVEAAAHGADAILLIAAILGVEEMRTLREQTGRYRMAALVEVHDAAELALALDSGAEIIGVNNRDLRSFETRLEISIELAAAVPRGVVRVSESGIHSAADVRRLIAAGYDAFLVGEHLMQSADAAAALRALRQV